MEEPQNERTFSMIKPDGVQRNLVGEVIKRFEQKGLKLAALKMITFDEETVDKLYGVHKEKSFYQTLVDLAMGGPAVVMVWEGLEAVAVVRKLVGATQSRNAEPGSIRGDYGMGVPENMIHASDSLETAQKEIPIFFTDSEIKTYSKDIDRWLGKE